MGVYHIPTMDAEIKKKITNRLNRIEGQVRGLQKMVEEEKYCVDILTQAHAARNSISSVEDALLENHLSEHVVHQIRSGEVDKVTDEVLSVYKLSKKK